MNPDKSIAVFLLTAETNQYTTMMVMNLCSLEQWTVNLPSPVFTHSSCSRYIYALHYDGTIHRIEIDQRARESAATIDDDSSESAADDEDKAKAGKEQKSEQHRSRFDSNWELELGEKELGRIDDRGDVEDGLQKVEVLRHRRSELVPELPSSSRLYSSKVKSGVNTFPSLLALEEGLLVNGYQEGQRLDTHFSNVLILLDHGLTPISEVGFQLQGTGFGRPSLSRLSVSPQRALREVRQIHHCFYDLPRQRRWRELYSTVRPAKVQGCLFGPSP